MWEGSAQPCGCDVGIGWMCEWHRLGDSYQQQTSSLGSTSGSILGGTLGSKQVTIGSEKIVIDPITGGKKGQKIERFDLIPPEAMAALAKHYGVGCQKYEDRNWEKGYKWGLSVGAIGRHLNQWLQGESYDQETGGHHLIAVAWHAFALFTFEVRGLGKDDVRCKRSNSSVSGAAEPSPAFWGALSSG